MEDKKGIVYLVGAGPGDPGLLTIRGKQCLEQAEVVVYDRLASSGLLDYAPKEAVLIDVGKVPGRHYYSQEEINQILIKYGIEGKRVVRLKGGDPFLFGRGGEEALALKEAGIIFEVVPGVTSALAVPAYAGIPVTHRGIATSVTIITGHEMEEKAGSQLDWTAIAKASQTLVILMGAANLAEIIGKLRSNGLAGNVPVALIENGTTQWQRIFRGTIETILTIVIEAEVKSPVIIIIGEVVGLAESLNWVQQQRPLLNKRVMITRPLEQTTELIRSIIEAGGEILVCPTIKINQNFMPDGKRIIQALANKDWLIFTSVNGVNGFFTLLYGLHLDARYLHQLKVAAIGEITGKVLAEKGILVDFIPQHFTSTDLVQELGPAVNGKKMLLLRVNEAPRDLADSLRKIGAEVEEFPVYALQTEIAYAARIKESLIAKTVDAVTFTSPSTVKGFLENIQGNLSLLNSVKVVCIGPVTARFAKEQNIEVAGIAANSSNEELIKVLIKVLGERREA